MYPMLEEERNPQCAPAFAQWWIREVYNGCYHHHIQWNDLAEKKDFVFGIGGPETLAKFYASD